MTTYKFHAKFGVDDIFSKMSFMHTVELYTLGKLNDLHVAGLCFLFFFYSGNDVRDLINKA